MLDDWLSLIVCCGAAGRYFWARKVPGCVDVSYDRLLIPKKDFVFRYITVESCSSKTIDLGNFERSKQLVLCLGSFERLCLE